jgi:uncharacterized protein YbjT (DUF2867 family)
MAKRTVIIAGATGLVGNELLKGLLADDSVTRVHSLGRRLLAIDHPKLTSHIVDFTNLPVLPAADELYLALGTTIKIAGSQSAFRAVDYDANLAVAKAALKTGVKNVGLVSAMGAHPDSRIFYSRVKGELETALEKMPFQGLVFARPSMLVGDREELGQPVRPGEGWASRFGKMFGFLIPANYQPINAEKVAKALLASVPEASGHLVLLSGAMQNG